MPSWSHGVSHSLGQVDVLQIGIWPFSVSPHDDGHVMLWVDCLPIFPTSSAHQLLFLLLFPLLIFLQTPKQSLDLQQDVQKGLVFLDIFDCPIQKVDIGTTSWSHSS